MEQYIPKSALVAEINQRIEEYKSHKIDDSYHDGLIFALEDLRDDFIDTLEVKEVEKEIPTWVREVQREDPFDDRWFIGMDDCLHRKGYKIKICDLWNLPKESLNT